MSNLMKCMSNVLSHPITIVGLWQSKVHPYKKIRMHQDTWLSPVILLCSNQISQQIHSVCHRSDHIL
uniref:Uncharacterized protein n=1 Tax=Arundo donax TaxID=35708 RepID=A0A0A9HE57_ARUDO